VRPFEIALWSTATAAFLWRASHQNDAWWARCLPLAVAVLGVVHLFVECPRWHLLPAYVAVVYVVSASVWPNLGEPRFATAVFGLGLLAIAAVLGTAFPIFELPAPTGSYPVGTATLHLVDNTRKDPRTDRADGCRELMVQLWYPAEIGGPVASYRTTSETSLKTRHLALVRTHAVHGAQVANSPARHPVLLFSPGSGGRRNHNTVQAEELASHGFVVAAMDHPYDTDIVVFPDGRTARCAGDESADVEESLRVRTADAVFVLDELERRNQADQSGLLTGRLDMTRCGVFGHSFGGAVAAELCQIDPRVAAGINFDGSIYGEAARHGYRKPFLFFIEDVPLPTADDIAKAPVAKRPELIATVNDYQTLRRASSMQQGQWITIRGARHVNYCDSPLYSPIWRLARGGPIRPERAEKIINAYVVSFFKRQLTSEEDGLLTVPPPFPEVMIEQVTQPGASPFASNH